MTARAGLFTAPKSGGDGSDGTFPQDARLALAGLITGTGIITGGAVVGSSAGPNMQYTIAAGAFATARGNVGSDGLYAWTNDAPVTVDSGDFAQGGPAPSSGSRWDLIWARAKNGNDGFGDADSLPEFGVTCSSAASSPTKPYGSVPAGALVLAESQVAANIANASLATVTMVAALVGARTAKPAWKNLYIPATTQTNTAGAQHPPQYWLNSDTGEVKLRGGLMKESGTFASNSVVVYNGTWNSEIIPSASEQFTVATSNNGSGSAVARLQIANTGIVTVLNDNAFTWFSFDGLSYYLT